MKTINDRFLEAMDFVGISAYYVAKNAGIAESTMSNVKSGKNKPSTELIEWLLNNYEVISADYILRGKGAVAERPLEQKIDAIISQLGEMQQTIGTGLKKYNLPNMRSVPKGVPKGVPKSKSKN